MLFITHSLCDGISDCVYKKKTYYCGNAFFIGKFKFWKANVILTIHTLTET